MKSYRVSEARARFGDLLDEALGGDTVVIERHGVRFLLNAEGRARSRAKPRTPFEFVDPAVLSGEWTWEPTARGVRFRSRRRRS
jgi:hypothetical protein